MGKDFRGAKLQTYNYVQPDGNYSDAPDAPSVTSGVGGISQR